MEYRHLRVQAHRAWRTVALAVATLLVYQGVGFAVGGENAISSSPNWKVLISVIPGGIRVHGVVLLLLGLGLMVESTLGYSVRMRVLLWALRFYCFLVAGCWLGSWLVYSIVWSAPGWWLFLAAATVWLSVYAPVPAPPPGGGRARSR